MRARRMPADDQRGTVRPQSDSGMRTQRCPWSRRWWNSTKNLSGKAFRFGIFRFGIFRDRIWSVKALPLPCFATEIRLIRVAGPAGGRGLPGSKQVLPYGPSLGKVAAGGAISQKVFLYYCTKGRGFFVFR